MSERDIVERLAARRPRHNQLSVDGDLFKEVDEARAEILRLRAALATARRDGWIAGRDAAKNAAMQAGYRRGDIGTLDAALHAISNMEPPEMSTDERRAEAIREYRLKTGRTIYQSDLGFARAIRTSDEAAGMVLVPRKATEAMIDVGAQECAAADHESYRTMARDAWDAMIAAATEADHG